MKHYFMLCSLSTLSSLEATSFSIFKGSNGILHSTEDAMQLMATKDSGN